MRTAVLTLALAVVLAAAPRAQVAADLPGRTGPVEVLASPNAPSFSLANLFSAESISIGHSYEVGYASGAFGDYGSGIYTTSLRWQPSARFAARADIGLEHAAFGSLAGAAGFSAERPARLFLRNAEVAYRPTDNSLIQLNVSQSPYGRACTYSCGYGGRTQYGARVGADGGLFWRDDLTPPGQ